MINYFKILAFLIPQAANSTKLTRFFKSEIETNFNTSQIKSDSYLQETGRHFSVENPKDKSTLLSKCFGKFGCFPIDGAWTSSHRPLNVFPRDPYEIRPGFWQFTRRSSRIPLRLGRPETVARSQLDPKKLTFMITHGYLEHGDKAWLHDLKDELLVNGDHNVIVLDWLKGSGPPYTQACANIRLIGVIGGHMLDFLHNLGAINIRKTHIIGHSLGAHLAGYVGSELRKQGHTLGRITGLDPAKPNFEKTSPVVRLDPSDAFYVDAIHTDGNPLLSMGLGMFQPVGHIDFYPNGGKVMRGCTDGWMGALRQEGGNPAYAFRRLVGCNHIRAYEYFIESINSKCPFVAVECQSWENFQRGDCNGCNQENVMDAVSTNSHIAVDNSFNPQDNLKQVINQVFGNLERDSAGNLERKGVVVRPGFKCDQMGFYAFSSYEGKAPRSSGREMFLLTGEKPPFCRFHYRVTIVLSDIPASLARGGDRGVFSMILHGNQGSSVDIRLSAETYFEPGRVYNFMTTTENIGRISSADLVWEYSRHPANPLTWRLFTISKMFVNRVEIEAFETHTRHTFCANDSPFESGVPQRVVWRPSCRENGLDPGPGLLGTVLNADPVGGAKTVLDFVNPLRADPLNGLEVIEDAIGGFAGGIQRAVRRVGGA